MTTKKKTEFKIEPAQLDQFTSRVEDFVWVVDAKPTDAQPKPATRTTRKTSSK